MSIDITRTVLFDGMWHSAGEPLIPVESRAVRYGDGCFETFRSYAGRFLKLEAHMNRLFRGLDYLHIKPPHGLEEMNSGEQIRLLLDKNSMLGIDAVVRIQVWREGNGGYDLSENPGSHYAVTVLPLPGITAPVRLAVATTRRIPAGALDSTLKLSNRINYIKASSEAVEKDADDALMLTVDGHVSETPVANIFWYRDGEIYTPSAECDILPGITRGIILRLLEEKVNRKLNEGRHTPDELMKAEVVWICNSVRELVAVESVDGRAFAGDHPILNTLKSLFKTYKEDMLT